MNVAENKAGARRAVELIEQAVAAMAGGDTLLGESATVARNALTGSTHPDRLVAVGTLERGKSAATEAAGHAKSAVEAVRRWHDAI